MHNSVKKRITMQKSVISVTEKRSEIEFIPCSHLKFFDAYISRPNHLCQNMLDLAKCTLLPLQADYRLDGSQQLLCVSTEGEGMYLYMGFCCCSFYFFTNAE